MDVTSTPKINGKKVRGRFAPASTFSVAQPTSRSEPQFHDRVVFLIGPDQIPRVMVHAMVGRFGPAVVLQEEKEPTSVMVKRRARMLGWFEALGQLGFGVWLKLLHKLSAARKREIFDEAGLVDELPASCTVHKIPSVNSDACRKHLQKLNPDLIVVIGTRMIRRETLRATNAKVVNYHSGINPAYRGQNGGYFALANGEPDKFGVTIHLVDEGVDTGAIIAQKTFRPTRADNFTTYPLVLAIVGRDILAEAIKQILKGNIKTVDVTYASRQWFHPTLWGYLWTGVTKGVW